MTSPPTADRPGAAPASVLPGLLFAVALGALATAVADGAGRALLGLEKSPISPVMVGILAGMALRNLLPLPRALSSGIRFSGTRVLRLGIILLGIRLSVFDVARLGALSLPVVIVCIGAGVAFTMLLARLFSLPSRLGTLIGVGTSICGVSAIAATGPVIRARDEEVAYAVAVITVFGMLAMIAYPFVAPLLFGGDATSVGLFLGTAVHDTSQVNAAGIIYADAHAAPRALDVAVVTKLVRNLFMIAVIPLMALRAHRSEPVAADGAPRRRVPLARLFPLFVVGFVLVAVLRSVGDATLAGGSAFGLADAAGWHRFCGAVQIASGWCLVTALSAVGLGTDFRALRSLRLRPFLLGLAAAVAVGVVSFAVVTLLRAAGAMSAPLS